MASSNTSYDVTSVPTEVWQDIIPYACLDGGFTARSLLLTSKYFHAQTHDHQFTCVALTSLGQLDRFLACMRLRSTAWTYPVRHLWVSFLKESPNKLHRLTVGWTGRRSHAMYELSSLVAPSLLTLSLAWGNDYNTLRWFGCEFPALEELTVWGSVEGIIPFPYGPSSVYEDGSSWNGLRSLPSLRRFHFISESPHARSLLLAPWATWLPASPITHLRLSDISVEDDEENFVEILAGAVGVPTPLHWSVQAQHSGDGPIVRNPDNVLPHLRYLWIHVNEIAWSGGCIPDDFEETWLVLKYRLHELTKSVGRVEGMRALMMEKSSLKDKIWEQRLWDDWVGRIEGQRGCWVESAEEETQLEGPDNPAREGDGQLSFFDY